MRLARATIAVATFLLVGSASESWAAEWTGSGAWENDANWANPSVYPNAPGAVALFNKNVSSSEVVSITGSVTVGSVNFAAPDNTSTFELSIGGTGSLTFDDPGGPATIYQSASFSETIGGAGLVRLAAGETLEVKVNGGGVNLSLQQNLDLSGRTIINSGTSTFGLIFNPAVQAANFALVGTNATLIQDSVTSPTMLTGYAAGSSITGNVEVRSGKFEMNSYLSGSALGSMTITLGDASGGSDNSEFMINASNTSLSVPNPFVLAPNTTGTARISFWGGQDKAITGGVTGSNSLTLFAVNQATVSGGALNFSGTLTHRGSGTTAIEADIGAAVQGVVQNSSRPLILTSNFNTFAGPTTVTSSSLQLGVGGTSGGLGNTSAITVGMNGTLVVNRSDTVMQSDAGTGLNNAVISGNGRFANIGSGTTVFTLANTYSGSTSVRAGTLQLGTGGTSGDIGRTSGIGVSDGAVLAIKRSDTVTQSGTGTGLNDRAITGGGGVTQAGTGVTVLDLANTYSGPTRVDAGTLTVAAPGSVANTSSVAVAAGARLNYSSDTPLHVAPTLAGSGTATGSRAVLGGTGEINAELTLDNLGDVLSPGNSPGIQPYAVGQTWESFSYDWEVNNWTGTTAGTAFDQIAITDGLLLSGTSYQLNLLSLTSGNASGILPNFTESNRSWTILSATGGITGFDAAEWSIGTAGFTTSPTWQGTFSLNTANGGQDLVLSYAAAIVPEPSTYAMAVAGLACGGYLVRRRRQRA
jgi:autotransporter-associated beta strand protein